MRSDKIKQTIYDMHLYKSRLESLIKSSIWIISWMGGILTIKDSCDGAASAYFLFSLSLLMEFATQIGQKKEKVAHILHALFCLLSAILLILSFGIIISIEIPKNILFVISIILTVYICIDCILLWLIPVFSPLKNESENDCSAKSEKEVECFTKNLTEGALGAIKK